MIESIRRSFNASFRPQQYQSILDEIEQRYPGALDFRIAETPVFISPNFKEQLIDTCEYILDQILDPAFSTRTEASIPSKWRIPGDETHPHFLAFDFGVCLDENGQQIPQLIEMQGFPSLSGYQPLIAAAYTKHFDLDKSLSPYLSGLDNESYIARLREIIVGDRDPSEVILLEILPHQQKTRIDFYITEALLGIPVVCITEIALQHGQLVYERDGKTHPIRRIYNRIIFDELEQQPEAIRAKGRLLTEAAGIEWCPHPHWFYRVSKYLLPYLHHPGIPRTFFLDKVTQIPTDLSQYVLKPLFSFAGQGVIIDPTPEDLERIADPANWILQRKVLYAPLIPTPDDPAKVEIRLMYFWPQHATRPIPAINLARLSKGKMVGTRYNKDRIWVGGSIGFFLK